jgi:hypothetical protein
MRMKPALSTLTRLVALGSLLAATGCRTLNANDVVIPSADLFSSRMVITGTVSSQWAVLYRQSGNDLPGTINIFCNLDGGRTYDFLSSVRNLIVFDVEIGLVSANQVAGALQQLIALLKLPKSQACSLAITYGSNTGGLTGLGTLLGVWNVSRNTECLELRLDVFNNRFSWDVQSTSTDSACHVGTSWF